MTDHERARCHLRTLALLLQNAAGQATGRIARLELVPEIAEELAESCVEASELLEHPREAEAPAPLDVMSREEWLAAIHDARGRRRSNAEIAERMGCNKQTVRRYLALHGIPTVLDELHYERLTIYQNEGDNGNDMGGEAAPRGLAAVGNGADGGRDRALRRDAPG